MARRERAGVDPVPAENAKVAMHFPTAAQRQLCRSFSTANGQYKRNDRGIFMVHPVDIRAAQNQGMVFVSDV